MCTKISQNCELIVSLLTKGSLYYNPKIILTEKVKLLEK